MEVLQYLLQDDNVSRFLRENYKKVPYSRPFASTQYNDILCWKNIEEILSANKSWFRVVKEHQLLHDPFTGQFQDLKNLFQQGHSVVIRYAERSHPELTKIASDFEKGFNAEVDIQAFITPKAQQTFWWHYDIEDVFIIQTSGEKKYRLRQNTLNPAPTKENMPNDLKYEQEKSPVFLSCTLKAGDWLYIPSGWWHCADAIEESTHLSIGLMAK